MSKIFTSSRQIVVVLFATFSFIANASGEPTLLKLSSLNSDCRLERRWIGRIFVFPYGAWLVCDEAPFLVTEPNNLLGHVSINSTEQALEYVRFFSSRKTYSFFNLDGMVELMPKGTDVTSEYFEVDQQKFDDFKAVEMTEIPTSSSESQQGVGKRFLIVRTVVLLDQTVLRITEQVSEDGFYDIVSKDMILKDASKIGIYHMGLT